MLAEVVCAWCNKHLGTKNVEVPDGMPAVTHGICPDCKDKQAEEGRKLAELKTGALDAEDAFDLDELERHADAMRTSIEATLGMPFESYFKRWNAWIDRRTAKTRGQEAEGHA